MYLKSYYLKNKGLTHTNFIRRGKNIYVGKKITKEFKIAPFHIKYLHQRYSKSITSDIISAIYDYSNSFDDIGILCKSLQ